jgi:hypothetical protein
MILFAYKNLQKIKNDFFTMLDLLIQVRKLGSGLKQDLEILLLELLKLLKDSTLLCKQY